MQKADRLSVYDEVTQRMVAALEAGVAPWVKPWAEGACHDVAIPRNCITGRQYSGVNVVLLWFFGPGGNRGYLTYKQAEAAGAQVREGEKGYRVVYADTHTEREMIEGVEHIGKAYSFLKRYTVFHVSQVDNLADKYQDLGPPVPPLPDAEFRAFVDKTGAKVVTTGTRCAYWPAEDCVLMPPWPSFVSVADYKAAMLHELVHWTGAKSRLAREMTTKKVRPEYMREELVAELGAAFLCATLGVVGKLQHAEYLGNWIGLLKSDNREIFRVASAAQRATDYLLNLAAGANQLQAAE